MRAWRCVEIGPWVLRSRGATETEDYLIDAWERMTFCDVSVSLTFPVTSPAYASRR